MEVRFSYVAKPTSQVKLIAKELAQNSEFILIDPLKQIYLNKKLNPEILNQIKDWNHKQLTPEQETLLSNLIVSENDVSLAGFNIYRPNLLIELVVIKRLINLFKNVSWRQLMIDKC